MLNRTFFSLSLFATAFCIVSQAAADVAPPETYVEQCTVDKKQSTTTECLACKTSRAGTATERCTQLLSPFCYENPCNSWGGTVYTQVWCRTINQNSPVVPDSVKAQLNAYDAPNLEGVGGSANCSGITPPATGGATSTTKTTTGSPHTATGGASTGGASTTATTTTVAIAAGGATTPNSSHGDGFVEETGCSLARTTNGAGAASLGLLGMLGVMLAMKRRS